MKGVDLRRKPIYCFDIDGVICDTKGMDYENAVPKEDNIKKINTLYEQGIYIKMYTGRGAVSRIDWRGVTEKQLDNWGVKYHELIFGKTPFDVFIDDHAWNVKDFERMEV